MFPGSLSEGIYRRSGGSCSLGKLLQQFRRDAWSVTLTPGRDSEHDVAGALKRFLRDLPDPLIANQQNRALVDALGIAIFYINNKKDVIDGTHNPLCNGDCDNCTAVQKINRFLSVTPIHGFHEFPLINRRMMILMGVLRWSLSHE